HRGVRDLAAHAAADARVVHVRDRILAERVGTLAQRQRRAAVEPHARVIAGADLGVYAEAWLHHRLARRRARAVQWAQPALALELALAPGDHDLEPLHARRQRLPERADHLRDVVGVHRADPRHADAPQRLRDGHARRLLAGVGAGGGVG